MIPTIVLTNDNHLWLLRGFVHQFAKHWPDAPPVTVYGYNAPDWPLPDGFSFRSLGAVNAPFDRWSNGLLHVLSQLRDDYLLLFLEDYWLDRRVNQDAFRAAQSFIYAEPDVLKVDLWGVRQQHARLVERRSTFDVLQLPNADKYSLSVQAAFWNRRHLASVLRENESPWQTEIDGSRRLADRKDLRVLSVVPTVFSYRPVWRARKRQFDVSHLSQLELKELNDAGALVPPPSR